MWRHPFPIRWGSNTRACTCHMYAYMYVYMYVCTVSGCIFFWIIMDLPHQPSSPDRLFTETLSLTTEFAIEIESKELSVDFHVRVTERPYGARVELVWMPFNYCKCLEEDCTQGQYDLLQQIFRVKNDWGLEALQRWLEGQKKFSCHFDKSTTEGG